MTREWSTINGAGSSALKRAYVNPKLFEERELSRLDAIARGLRGRHQKEFQPAKAGFRLISAKQAFSAGNPHARVLWLRAASVELTRELGASAPWWGHDKPAHLLTIVDRRFRVDTINSDQIDQQEVIRDAIKAFRRALRGTSYFGMVDFALYVSASSVFGVSRLIHPHLHAVLWGISETEAKQLETSLQAHFKPLFPYAAAAQIDEILPRDLLQVIWYVCKLPYRQHQVHKRVNGRVKQYKRPMNFVNHVRMLAFFQDKRLPELALAGGCGEPILKAVLAATRSSLGKKG